MTGLILVLLLAALADAETTCPALRTVEQTPQPQAFVYCTTGRVEISIGEYHSNTSVQGNLQQFCPPGDTYTAAGEEPRWQTPSGFPGVCEVYTRQPNIPVRLAALVHFVHHDGAEEEIATSDHALVYEGTTLVGFDPPVPGITVGE
jgi:hypothetical protein